jgi:hypothetical protein
VTAATPPGRSTRAISFMAVWSAGMCSSTSAAITRSKQPSGNGIAVASPAGAAADAPGGTSPASVIAVGKVSTERNVVLTVVGKPAPGGPTERLVAALALGDKVRFVSGITDTELAEFIATAEIAVVPSLYEGFSLPAVEHMASGTPLIASRTGALPEVTGDAALLVTPGDPEELAMALRTLHDSPAERERLSALALQRVQERFAWSAVARATVDQYHRAIEAARSPAAARATRRDAAPC